MGNVIYLFLLTLALEGATDDHWGRVYIAQVILNRAEMRFTPRTPEERIGAIKKTILQPHQFSCWDHLRPEEVPQWAARAADEYDREFGYVVERYIRGGVFVLANVYGEYLKALTHYYAKAMPMPPSWAREKEPAATSEKHFFFKEID